MHKTTMTRLDGTDGSNQEFGMQELTRNLCNPSPAIAIPEVTRGDRPYPSHSTTFEGSGVPHLLFPRTTNLSDKVKGRSECMAISTNDLEESVGSISAGNPGQDDCESEDEQDSGHYSPMSSTSGPSPNNLSHFPNTDIRTNVNALKEAKSNWSPKKGGQYELRDSYDRNEKGRRESLEGKENLDRTNSFALSDTRQGDEKTQSESKLEEIPAKKSPLSAPQIHVDESELTSETEMSESDSSLVVDDDDDDEGEDEGEDDDDDDDDNAVGWVPYRTSVEDAAALARLRLSSDSGIVRYVDQKEKCAKPSKLAPPTHTLSPPRKWLSEPDTDEKDKGEDVRFLRRSNSDGIIGPPSAPPMLDDMVLEPPDRPVEPSPASPTYSAQNAFGYDAAAVEQSAPTKRFETSVRSVSTMVTEDVGVSCRYPATPVPLANPVFLSGQAAWQSMIAYDGCVRLCLRAWSRGSTEAPEFLQDECAVLRDAFGLTQILLQPQEDRSRTETNGDLEASVPAKPKITNGKLKIQVKRIRIITNKPILRGHTSGQRSLAYMNAGAHYMRQMSGLFKEKVNNLRLNAVKDTQEIFTCVIKLKSSSEEELTRIQPGSSDSAVLFPESSGDELLMDILDSKGTSQGRLLIPVASISNDPNDRVRWYGIYNLGEHDCVGKVQLFLHYTTESNEFSTKWGPVGETRAYDIVLDVAKRVQQFQRRNLRLQGPWVWLLSEFASCYGVSESYTKLRYLACIMEIATPTQDCLVLINELLEPIIKARDEKSLNRQEKRILVEVEEHVEQLLALVFENYKSLDEASTSGLAEAFTLATGSVSPALIPAVQLFTLMHDILSAEAQSTLRKYIKTGAWKRCKRHMAETDEYVLNNSEGFLMDPLSMTTAYQKMKTLCQNLSSEIRTDIEIHNKHVLPSSIDLPNLTATIYGVELANRLRTFLVACPPSSPLPIVTDLMLSTADFQRDLASWGIRSHMGGVDAKELFHLYVVLWIQDKRLHLLDFCKFDKERCTLVTTQHNTSAFVEEAYERIKETLNEYEVIIHRWPEYTIPLEHAMADVERAVVGTLEKQFADVIAPLKDFLVPKKFGLQYMQKLTRRQKPVIYNSPTQLGVMVNTIKRLLDTLRPKIEAQMKTWAECLPEGAVQGGVVFGERHNEVTIELRAKYKNYLHAIVEKLAENARLQNSTKLKRILHDTREAGGASDIGERMQPLTALLEETISNLHDVFTSRVFVAVCRGYWDRTARDVLQFLESKKENRLWYKSTTLALGILDDIFAAQMQRLQGRALQDKDLEPPRSVAEARSMLSRDTRNGADSFY
ncbi:uncharacterized protein [Physcomitrium patens]|uniref:uncharacterized protein isoform X2 n=1 Tax=Physcomitrium patens TaxID=3218 RepID=UPI000D15EDC8|nr:uncharacterized protein LOC112276976 isoform X2 [Physcomitrium patens]|eukprot:XP_024364609.1 uncharacterized protein LOC112276976 isoform X2 [Physcomitrella patens]